MPRPFRVSTFTSNDSVGTIEYFVGVFERIGVSVEKTTASRERGTGGIGGG